MPAVKAPSRSVKERVRRPSWPAAGSLPGIAERASLGKTARSVVPREDHAMLDLPEDRPDPLDLLEQQARTRLAELVPVRYGRMLVSPFAYFRGAALPMAEDLAATPSTGLTVQACGDAHLSNFGVFGSAERRLVFDINDFDETLPGPWEWDVKRLAASLEIAARENGFPADRRRKILVNAIGRYRQAMLTFAGMNDLDVWYARADVDQLRVELKSALTGRLRKALDKGIARARTRDSMQAVGKLTRVVDGRRRIIADPPLIMPISDLLPEQEESAGLEDMLPDLLAEYCRTLREDSATLLSRFQYADLARKVVGVGSVGTRCWVLLMVGVDDSPLFLQVKEAEQSVLSRFTEPSTYHNEGQRVVVGQRFTQASSDLFLGWFRMDVGLDGKRHDYYVRQLRDWKLSVDIAGMSPGWMRRYGGLCGWTLARAHARTGDRVAIAAYLGGATVFEEAIADFAASYADLNERDYQKLKNAASSGRITVQRGL
jgi:uncharacterized protein (DUF2252 family)